ncbi:MAG TPA: RNA methyltransferase [Gemmatimonadales bacterium]|jgi:TrmH family RNA methyltransferase|nr:RNA methyltransferase [Gemmatimonadales bacterium]
MSHSLHTLVRDLHLRRGRERRGLALAEGVRLVEEALGARVAIRHVLASPALEATPRGRALKAALAQAGHPVESLSEKAFRDLAATEHSQGVLAVIEPRGWRPLDVVPTSRAPALVLDGVQDPGNVGSLVRTAWALGASGVLALPGTAELSNPKTLRATMGGGFHLPFVSLDEAALREWARACGARVLVAEAGGPPPTRSSGGPVVLVVGNEGAGIRPSLVKWADGRVGIPLRAGAESLNVGVAAGILLYQLTRE